MRLKEFLQKGGLANNPNKVQNIIDKYSNSNSPLTAEDYITVSNRTGVPIELLLAQGAVESNFGTQGRAVRTKNVGNVGNTDSGAAEYKNTWRDGLLRQANLLKNEYKVSSYDDINRLINNRFERPTGGHYASAPNYSQQIAKVLNSFSDQKFNVPNQTNTPTSEESTIQPLSIQDTRQFLVDDRGSFQATSPEFGEFIRLENEKTQQEQKAKEAELRNQKIQAEIEQKSAERNQLISMIPQAQYVGSQYTQPQQF